MEGLALKSDLPVSLRGAQSNSYIFNYENNAIEVLNVDAVGANQPNNTTGHYPDWFGPEMSMQAEIVAAEGECYIFKFAIGGTALGPTTGNTWNVSDNELYGQFNTRWAAFIAAMTTLGHSVVVPEIYWMQGEADAIIEGHDEAYYGLFKRLIKQLRIVLAPYTESGTTIKWITGLVHSTITAAGFQYLYPQVQNVRAAQRKAGWNDPAYRIVDTDSFSRQVDQVHLDADGMVAFGEALWAAAQLEYNNSMAYEDYNLGSLRSHIAEEFGIDVSIAENAARIDKRINAAISWVVNRRKNWPWLERDASIDTGDLSSSLTERRYGSGIFTMSSTQVVGATWSNGNIIYPRELIDFNGQGYEGLGVSSYAGTTINLRRRYKGEQQICTITSVTLGNPTIFTVATQTSQGGTLEIPENVATFSVIIDNTVYAGGGGGTFDGTRTATRVSANQFSIPIDSTSLGPYSPIGTATAHIAREFSVAQSYFELPVDYIRNSTMHIDEMIDENTVIYRDPTTFMREVYRDRLMTGIDRIYTVVPDPLRLSSNKFVAVYPYMTERHTLFLNYFGDAPKLIADADEPVVPRSDRLVVLYAASWLVAQWQKDNDLVSYYRDIAYSELERMTVEHQFSDDVTQDHDPDDYNDGPIRGPGNFPEFELP